MRYEWDQAKDALNLRKHGLRLEDGIPALEDPERESWIDDRFDYLEERLATIGMNLDRILFVVSTERGPELMRIISVRRAKDEEVTRYYGRA
ncbi:BrnT family toxin [Acidobacteria bacterium AB60]|nr:BrnT family toxin [Acidobacteria bacterium AB60]